MIVRERILHRDSSLSFAAVSLQEPPPQGDLQRKPAPSPAPQPITAKSGDMLAFFLLFRLLNAFCVRTFFQPDEYFQVLEPAWSMAFGADSGAWLTWEWEYQLRSSLHPALFGVSYKVAYWVMGLLDLVPSIQADVLVTLPKVVQSVFAAASDFYTWKLAGSLYGVDSNSAWAAFWVSVFNPWLWYCSTRTFSNSVETTLTIAALYYWPWQILGDAKEYRHGALQRGGGVNSLRLSLVLAAIAVLLRPTNILIWLAILTLTVTRFTFDGESPLNQKTLLVLIREVALCGSAVLAVSVASDRLYFGFWTFPPYKWLYFNISQSLAVFYGQMPWHYYLSQGIPLLSTTFLPFVLIGLYKASTSPPAESTLQSNTIKTLSFTVLAMIGALSTISHKEVRFIYPLLPTLQVLAAPYVASFFTVPTTTTTTESTLRHRFTLATMLSINLLLGLYLSTLHQPAPLTVLTHLRHEFERLHSPPLSLTLPHPPSHDPDPSLFVLFLTPCHSTPWRSHLVYPSLRARALTCEPPLHTSPGSAERINYRDEADRFYDDPVSFLGEEMDWGRGGGGGGEVPKFIVGFEGVEGMLDKFLESERGQVVGVRLERTWEGWNGLFNEDWRRRGSLVVWEVVREDGEVGE